MRSKRKQNTATSLARVLIVDDHELMRNGLRLLIDSEPNLEICGEAEDEASARRMIDESKPDVAIVDLTLQGGSGLALTKWITQRHPQTKTIVSTMHNEQIYGPRILRAGARGYVNKHDPARTILVAIRRVLEGKLYFSEELTEQMMNLASTRQGAPLSQSPIENLSNRELEIFRLIGQGLTTDQIADGLHLSANTVGTYRERLKTKLGASGAAELSRMAMEWTLQNE